MRHLFSSRKQEKAWTTFVVGVAIWTGLACVNAIGAIGDWTKTQQWPEPDCYPGHEDWPICDGGS